MVNEPTPLPARPQRGKLWQMRLWRKQALAYSLLALVGFGLFGLTEAVLSYREALRNLARCWPRFIA